MALKRREKEAVEIEEGVVEYEKEENVSPIEQIKKSAESSILPAVSLRFDQTVSTGSTLLDLCISGRRVRGGGICGGILVELFGPPGTGKTAILEEIAASVQIRGGQIRYHDPEARLDHEYAEVFDVHLLQKDYFRPVTVTEVFDKIWEEKFNDESALNAHLVDSLAALSTELEMSKEGDKRGQKRAKEFSEGLRKTCRMMAEKNLLIACSNQVRDGDFGMTTPGGQAVKFYASLRIKLTPAFVGGKYIEKEIDLNGKKIKKVVGIRTDCEIVKSSLDDPYGKCVITILFNRGIDDIRDNLQYCKSISGEGTYDVLGHGVKGLRSMERAIEYIEENGLEKELREKTIDLWLGVQELFKDNRKRKVRF
jgi:RecA/RadA recombinase